MNQHNMTIQQELEASRTEAEDVKLQLQHYCCEVQRIEEILSKKESERLDLLKHLKFISQETAELENNNHSLDGEMKSCKNLLAESEKKVMKLEALVQDKDCSIKSLEAKLEELSHVTAQLETQVQCCQEEKYRLGEELAGCQETLDTMLRQKEELRLQLADTENYKTKEAGKGEE
ncbi:rab11 family-interacting protein 3 [Diaphorina citri]|uniref:Rab11 family-interacting protein 3 n=1 Tax=Diaphorina citri TaxID=121845 RepID=A0A3Q0JI34_DIACI|nr:rab11 family-interacting protein 3 [Diaphorina citri]